MPNLPCFYAPPPGFGNGHIQTVFPSFFRKEVYLTQQRIRIVTPGDDFLELDASLALTARKKQSDGAHGNGGEGKISPPHEPASDRVVIISHGLEGNSRRKYVKGMAKMFNEAGCDAIAWNQPGCGGEPARNPRIYHMGETRDLQSVIDYALGVGYTRIGLVGFSMGGNQILRFAGEAGQGISPAIKGIVVFSVPCDLPGSVRVLNKRANRAYMFYFMRTLHPKIRQMHSRFPGLLNIEGLGGMFTFSEFDGRFTAPLNGFASSDDYYAKASSLPLLGRLTVPSLLVNAADDPFLSASCYPYAAAEKNPQLFLKVPASGGHVGFVTFNTRNRYWSEQVACEFLQPLL